MRGSGNEMLVSDYLGSEETTRRRELVWGVVREPAAPLYGHQRIVTDLAVLLHSHVRRYGLGEVIVSPIDVVLDEKKALVLQPDVVFVSNERRHLIRGQIWGAPDLVIEVLSLGSSSYDTRDKRSWYSRYGVKEYWVVNPVAPDVAVHAFDGKATKTSAYGMRRTLRSRVLPDLRLPVARLFRRPAL